MNDRETPMDKIHEYGSHYRCPKCDEIVGKHDKYCSNCGQRLGDGDVLYNGDQWFQTLDGWCADK